MTKPNSQITLVLDNLRSCQNVGSILRTAEGLGATNVIAIGTTPYPAIPDDTRLPHLVLRQTKQISKTALGAEQTVPISYLPSVEDYLDLPERPVLACLEQSADSVQLSTYKTPKSLHLVLGNEVNGVCQALLDAADAKLEIPMSGKKESFNVAVATGIALYHLRLASA